MTRALETTRAKYVWFKMNPIKTGPCLVAVTATNGGGGTGRGVSGWQSGGGAAPTAVAHIDNRVQPSAPNTARGRRRASSSTGTDEEGQGPRGGTRGGTRGSTRGSTTDSTRGGTKVTRESKITGSAIKI